MEFIIILLFISITYIVFRIRYSKPLTEKEIKRDVLIKRYYQFNNGITIVDNDFKKKMYGAGNFYVVNKKLEILHQ